MTKKVNNQRIALIGAYGYTGRIILDCLQEAGIQFTAIGRDSEKLHALDHSPSLQLDLQSKEDRESLLNDFDTFLNCAGPFGIESKEFIQELALKEGKTYLDITGELDLVRSIKDSCKDSNSLIIQGVAFESLLVDLIYRKYANDLESIHSLESFYRFSESRPSPGTKITMKLSNLKSTYFLQNGSFELVNDSREEVNLRGAVNLAVPYPLPEVAYCSWDAGVETAGSYMLLSKAAAMFVGAKGNKEDQISRTYDKLKNRKVDGPDLIERSEQSTRLYIRFNNDNTRVVLLEAEDMYLITAKAIVNSLEVILNGVDLKGVHSPASLFKGAELETLKALGVSHSITNFE